MPQIKETIKKETDAFNRNNTIMFAGELLTLNITTHIGRMCARLAGYMLWSAGDREAADILFQKVGR